MSVIFRTKMRNISMIHCEAAREFSNAVEEIFDEQFNEVPKVDIAIV